MQCINDHCDGLTTKVVETRATLAVVHRRRKCVSCGWSFISIEVLAPDQKMPLDDRRSRRKKEVI